MITEKDVQEFRDLYKRLFSVAIDKKSARQKLTILVRQMEIVYKAQDGSEKG